MRQREITALQSPNRFTPSTLCLTFYCVDSLSVLSVSAEDFSPRLLQSSAGDDLYYSIHSTEGGGNIQCIASGYCEQQSFTICHPGSFLNHSFPHFISIVFLFLKYTFKCTLSRLFNSLHPLNLHTNVRIPAAQFPGNYIHTEL